MMVIKMDKIIEELTVLLERNQGFCRVQLDQKNDDALYFIGFNASRQSYDIRVEIDDELTIDDWPISARPEGEISWVYLM